MAQSEEGGNILGSIISGIGSLLGGLFGSKKKKKAIQEQNKLLSHLNTDVDNLSGIIGQTSKIMYIGFGVVGLILIFFIARKGR